MAARVGSRIFFGANALLLGSLLVLALPRTMGNCVRILRHSPWRCAMAGGLVCGIVPLVGAFALSTLVASPLGANLLAALALFAGTGNIVVALALGSVLLKQRNPQPLARAYFTMAVGLVLLYAAKTVPVLGVFVDLYGWFTGIGALLLNLTGTQRIMPHQEPPPIPGNSENGNQPQP